MSTALGQAAQSFSNQFLGGTGAVSDWAQSMAPGTAGMFNPGGYFGAPPTVDNPMVGSVYGSTGVPAFTPPTTPSGAAAPGGTPAYDPFSGVDPAAALSAFASPSAASTAGGPVMTGTIPGSPAVPLSPGDATTAATYGAGGVAGGGPSLWDEFRNWLGSGAGGGGGGAGGAAGQKGMGLGGWLGLGGAGFELLNRYLLQRQLQNPAGIAAGAQAMARPLGAAARQRITAPVTAMAQETSGVNAPGLYSQAISEALAPYQYNMYEQMVRNEIAALDASAGAYPNIASSLVLPNLYGGSQSAVS